MSNQVFVNPEEIDVFINEIRIFLDTLNSSTNRVNNAFENLSSTWQDRKKAEFEEQYRELLRVLKIFEESSEEKINHLTNLSQKAKDYLGS